ncbi:hypothetical protein [Sulfurisphaera tokodaii]|uniref:Uncharacterized protein n=2 Tax=Sulfurisphaera tokodaii TaxID=111955 RepID=Q96Z47_SULTO|nr:hypothetical protein [Sulfurisphaera tokodaii]BAB67079.1 hypothetical protein STK_19850 [Sulfurisphaera tokodaii str. 7]HII73805.1 hypothetical protein [Sulfurisphaera tokodaii]
MAKINFRTNYPIKIGNIRIIIKEIELEENGNTLNVVIDVNTSDQLSIQIDELIIDDDIIIRPKRSVVRKVSQVDTSNLPMEIVIDITKSDDPKIGYIRLNGIEYNNSSVKISKVKIYFKNLYKIDKIKLIENYKNLYNAEKAVEYTIVNKMNIPIRYVILTPSFLDIIGISIKSHRKKKGDNPQNLSLHFSSSIIGLQVTDEKGNRLNYLTFYELSDVLPSNITKHNYIIIDLGNTLKPEERRTIILSKQINVDAESYIAAVPLINGIATEVLIRPPHGYFIIMNVKGGSISLLDTEYNGTIVSTRSITLEREVTNLQIDNLSLTVITDHEMENGEISSISGINFKFICNYSDNLHHLIYILHEFKIKGKIFWEYLFSFLSMIVYGLFLQELAVDVMRIVYDNFLPLLVPLSFAIGSFMGYVIFLRFKYVRIKSLGEFITDVLKFSRNFIYFITLYALVILGFILYALINITSISQLSRIANIYLEMEFAILVVLELPTILIEREIGDLYGKYLLSLIILTTFSMFLLIPWIV